jgi:uncharacterized protein (TIGR02147 family)
MLGYGAAMLSPGQSIHAQKRKVSVFDYQSPRQFLLDALSEKQKKNPGYSLRQWCLKMGQKSHTLVTLILQGKRPLRIKHAAMFARGLDLASQENVYFQGLIQMENATTPEEKKLCALWLSDLHPGGVFTTRELDEFSVISDWVHMTILSMTRLKGLSGSPEEISKRLGLKVSTNEVRAAVSRLLDLGLIQKNKDGKLEATYHRVTSKDEIASSGGREYHRQVIDLAKNAIEAQSIHEREFQSFGIAIAQDKIQLAKDMIKKFRAQFAQTVGARPGEGDEVYQTNIQFFRLTESPREKSVSSEDEGAKFNDAGSYTG